MTSYQQYQQQFARALVPAAASVGRAAPSAESAASAGWSPALEALVDAFPYYGDPDWDAAHRGALGNLLESNLPNNRIAPHPNESGFGYATSYSYNGSYSGYRDAFFHGVGQTAAANQVAALVQGVNGGLNGSWWGNYGVTVLTDAVRQRISIGVNSSKLTSDLSSNNGSLLPALAASYLGVFQVGYAATAAALNAINASGQAAASCTALCSAIAAGQFTANINQAIAMGGDSTNAATWFLFNLWIALKALGCADVDGAIRGFQAAGLVVPGPVGPSSWWNGGYTSWYVPLSGSDVVSVAGATITASMPEQSISAYASPAPVIPIPVNTSEGNGYSQSLVNWGSLNWYTPPSSSCFGVGTGVLMADGSVKPIERVQVGDLVLSQLGPRKVVLIESPRRGKRTLYQLNSLDLFVTSGHPFRAANPAGPLRLAIEPWVLLDAIPTMTAAGVGTLDEGALLAGRSRGDGKSVLVTHIDRHEVGDGDAGQVCVYDLLLENWEKGYATYFVGGPETFLAVDAETADPLHDLPGTAAILAAMEVALPACRDKLTDPERQLPVILSRLGGAEWSALQGRAARQAEPSEMVRRPPIPGPAFYMRDGAWDPHASLLEHHLVRQFGRVLRREAASGWRGATGAPAPGDHLAVYVHDVEWLGESPLPGGTAGAVQLQLRGWTFATDLVEEVAFRTGDRPTWHLTLDRSVDLGRIPAGVPSAALVGAVVTELHTVGRFRAVVDAGSLQGGASEQFLFAPGGEIIGRIALELRRVARPGLVMERRRAEQWTERHALAAAIGLGRQIGHAIASQLQR
jgi:hypothetical protein